MTRPTLTPAQWSSRAAMAEKRAEQAREQAAEDDAQAAHPGIGAAARYYLEQRAELIRAVADHDEQHANLWHATADDAAAQVAPGLRLVAS